MPPRHPKRSTRPAAAALVRVTPLLARRIERELGTHEPPLTVAQYLALEALEDGPVAAAELARQAAVSPAAVSQLVTALEGAGLVERSRAETDRRRQPLTTTAAGASVLRSARRTLETQVAATLSDLPPHEADALGPALTHVDALLRGAPPPPKPRKPHPPPPPR